MTTDHTLVLFQRFKLETADDTAAALLTVAATLGEAATKRDFLNIKQAAECRGVSPSVIYRMVKDGKLKHTKTGRSIRIARADLEAA